MSDNSPTFPDGMLVDNGLALQLERQEREEARIDALTDDVKRHMDAEAALREEYRHKREAATTENPAE